MTITNQDVDIYCGDSALLEVSLTDANGDPFALSAGGTIKYRVANSAHAEVGEFLIEKELGAGIDLQDGVASITLLTEDTDITPQDYYHEIKVFDQGDVATAMTGNFKIRQSLRFPTNKVAQVTFAITGNMKA